MPDMSEYHETEDEMEDRCDSQRDSEKLDDPKPKITPESLVKALDDFRRRHNGGR